MIKPCMLCQGDGFFVSSHCSGDPEDPKRGLYQKFWVSRTDRKHRPGKRHGKCPHFVLDLWPDRFAPPALRAYATACEKENPELAQDLREAAVELERRIPKASPYATSMPEGHVGIKGVTVKRETHPEDPGRGGILIRVGRKEAWIPKYVIHDDSPVFSMGTSGTLIIPLEWAEKKELA